MSECCRNLLAEVAKYKEALEDVLSELGQCNDEEKERGYCAGHPMLTRLPCPVAEARNLVGWVNESRKPN